MHDISNRIADISFAVEATLRVNGKWDEISQDDKCDTILTIVVVNIFRSLLLIINGGMR